MAAPQNMNLFQRLKNSGRTADGSTSFINEWEAVRYLGRGNFGVVYEIEKINKTLGEQHSALKIIELDEKSIEKYKDEIAALNSIRNHPHGVSIEDFSELHLDEGDFVRRYVLIRMELLRPMPEDGMSEEEVIQMALDVSDVLADCHGQQRKILHCDIKPVNILMTEDRRYKLSDFGEARFLEKSHGSSGMRGTPLYMSPEMASFKGYDERSDLYSLGVTMYAMLNGGCVPFYSREMGESGERNAIYRRLAGEKFPRIKGARTELLRIIGKLCEIDPNKRYQRASQLNRDLKALVKKRDEELRRKEDAEIARRLKEKKKKEDAQKRLDAKQHRDAERRKREAEKEAARAAQLEKQNENLLLGETINEDQRESITQVSSLPASAASITSAKKTFESRAVKIATVVMCAVILTGTAIGVGIVIDRQQGTPSADVILTEDIINGQTLPPATAADQTLAKEFCFERTGDGCRITGYIGHGGEISIPESYNGYPVVGIGNHVFANNTAITRVAIPNSVREIEDYAFYGCTGLKEIALPDSISRIGVCALYGCSNLSVITIPEGVTVIEDKAFWGCSGLTSISIPENVTRIGNWAFCQCSGLTSAEIPASVTSIGDGAFSKCLSLSSVTITGSITRIGAMMFSECLNLTSVSIPDSVVSIGDEAFSSCLKLTEVVIPNSVTDIGNTVFSNCSSLTSVVMPESMNSIGSSVFFWCDRLESVTMPERANSIGGSMFWYCGSLTSVSIPDGVTSIDDSMFFGCTSLTSVTVPDSVTSIGKRAFEHCEVTVNAPHEASYYGYTPSYGVRWKVKG